MILIDDIGWITCQEMTDVFEGFTTHGDAGIDGAGSDVGGEYDVLQSVEGFCDVRFVFEDIQGCTCYLTFFNTSASACSSTTAPRAVLTRMAVGFIKLSSRCPIRCRVAGVKGV